MIKDMTVGAPTKMIIGFGIPLLIGNLFQQLYNISDILIVGRLIGVEALAAVVLAHLMGYRGIFYASPIAWVGAAVVVSIGYWMTIHGLKKKMGSASVHWSFRREKADDEATQSLTAE